MPNPADPITTPEASIYVAVEPENCILPIGRFPHPNGMQAIDADTISRVTDAILKDRRDIPVDYGHESFSSPRAKVAGWLQHKSLYETSDGLMGKIVWTKEAIEKIRARKYRFLSPVLVFNPKRSQGKTLYIERLVSAGLTNHPNIPAMKPLVVSQLNTAKPAMSFYCPLEPENQL